jgi:hypothetical protein
MNEFDDVVGRVLRASTRGYVCGTHSTRLDSRHDFGAFVKVPIANDESIIALGVIYAIEIKDDLLINELVMAEAVDPNVLRDQRENRMIPVEISVLNVGYTNGRSFVHSIPPRPPMSLSQVMLCTRDDVLEFTKRFDFLRLILQASEVPSEALVGAAVRYSSYAYEATDQEAFLIRAGQHLAKTIGDDTRRLSAILGLLHP